MIRLVHGLSWLGVSLVLLTAGCSNEPPPAAALGSAAVANSASGNIDQAADGQSTANDTAPDSVFDAVDAKVPETPDAAVLKLLGELRLNHPDAVWDALPESYRRDLNSLSRLFGERLHPQAWRWFSQIARKSAALVSEFEPEEDPREAALRLVEWLASGEQTDLERLQRADLGRLLRTRGRPVMADLRVLVESALSSPEAAATLRDIAGPLPEVFDNPSLLQLTIRDLDADRCTLVIQLPVDEAVLAELYRLEVAFVRVEGKWIPQALFENWDSLIATARDWITQALPASIPQDNFGIVFRYLAQLDSMVEFELAAASGEQAIEPTLFDVVEYLLGFAEDLGFPIPAALSGESANEMPGESTGEAGATPAAEPADDADRKPSGNEKPADESSNVDTHSARTNVLAPRIQACC
ncbi:MAG: hypothetical protein HY290_22540 [Planctomycetia bacterium]|nr:hypothetical protein [Planctomycetia bacterium]